MKTKRPSVKFFQCMLATVAIAIVGGLSVSSAQAGYILVLHQVGPDVVATGSGPLDLSGLTFQFNTGLFPGLTPSLPAAGTGPTPAALTDAYEQTGPFAGPTSFGPGTGTGPDSGSGDPVGIFTPSFGNGFIFVPVGYVSNSPLSDHMAFNNATFSSLGVTPGVYEWTWGTGANQNFTLKTAATIPDSGSTFGLLLLALAALVGASRLRSIQLA
jgi:VPDSG-CTERM motif